MGVPFTGSPPMALWRSLQLPTWQASLTPMLFTHLAQGFPSLLLGLYLFLEDQLTITSVLLLSISLFSLMPSLAHILADFASILAQLDEEGRLRDDIVDKSKAALEQQKTRLRLEREAKEAVVHEEFKGMDHGHALVQKNSKDEGHLRHLRY